MVQLWTGSPAPPDYSSERKRTDSVEGKKQNKDVSEVGA